MYKPIAQEFSLSKQPNLLKSDDYSLPTREYIIFSTVTGSKLLLWYNNNAKVGNAEQKLAHCSTIEEQTDLYTKAFEAVTNSSGVHRFEIDDNGIEKLESLEKGLYPQNEVSNQQLTPKKLLVELQDIRNKLITLNDKDQIIKTGLEIVREKLYSQTASIFLCGKEGQYCRANIIGTDLNGEEIDHKNWFNEESYIVGESFTGQAIIPKKDGFGQPQISNRLEESDLDRDSVKKYHDKLGLINCAMAVPLNGQNKTFGVLEVINKIDAESSKPEPFCGFDPNEIYYLSAIGSFIATAISNYRRYKQRKLYADLAELVVKPKPNNHEILNKIAERLVSDETAFTVCIIRIEQDHGLYKIQGFNSIKTIDNTKRKDEAVSLNHNLAIAIKNEDHFKIVPNLKDEINNFNNKEWIIDNALKSFALLPITYAGKIIGTLSVYTKYEYDFHESCLNFLTSCTSIIAAFVSKYKEKELKEKKNRYLRDEVLPKLPKKQQLEAARKLMDDNFNSKKKPKLSTSKQLD